jgi:hypothetical protein
MLTKVEDHRTLFKYTPLRPDFSINSETRTPKRALFCVLLVGVVVMVMGRRAERDAFWGEANFGGDLRCCCGVSYLWYLVRKHAANVRRSHFWRSCVCVVPWYANIKRRTEAVTPLRETCRLTLLSFPTGQQACREILSASDTSVGVSDASWWLTTKIKPPEANRLHTF